MSGQQSIPVALAGIFVLGVGAQWVASRLKVPSILLLLATGIVAGPVLQLISPDRLLGDLLLPIVSLSVGIVLFEGSLSLRLADLREIGRPLLLLLTVGVAITWVLATAAARVALHLPMAQCVLLGSILTVTGPTVIGPLLRDIRPLGSAGPVARWEGIVVDPIGAVLAALVFSAYGSIRAADFSTAAVHAMTGFVLTMLIGFALGTAAACLLLQLMRRHWIPDHLESPFTLMLVVGFFTASNQLLHESGLVTVTVMGLLLANQKRVSVHHVIEFKEALSVLLISTLFILLSARLSPESFGALKWRGPLFVILLILIVRPVSVWVSTIGSGMSTAERLFLSWLAPRGIVAAAVASVFALELAAAGESADRFVSAVFMVIIGTVVIYGLTAGRLARALGLSVADPQGVLFASAHPGARAIACALHAEGVPVCLVDTNSENIRVARMEGLRTFYADILSEAVLEEIDLGGIGRLLAMTPNDEVNSLAARRYGELFGRAETYRLPSAAAKGGSRTKSAKLLSGRVLFGEHATYRELDNLFADGFTLKTTGLTDEYTIEDFRAKYGESALILFVLDVQDKVHVCTTDREITYRSGQTLIALVRTAPEPA